MTVIVEDGTGRRCEGVTRTGLNAFAHFGNHFSVGETTTWSMVWDPPWCRA